MKNFIFGTLCFFLLNLQVEIKAQEVQTAKFSLADFGQLHEMKGSWKGMAGNSPFFERYEIKNDTLIEITHYSDATLSKMTGKGIVYFSNGNIYHSSGNSVWKVKKKEGNTFHFEPFKNASNTFRWTINNRDSWTAEVGSAGRARTYEMQKIK